MAKQLYIDENGNPIEVSGTINNASMLPISANDSTDTKTYIDTGLSGKVGSDYITTQTFSLDNLSVANNTDYNYQIDVTKAGYTPIGIIQSSFIGNYGTRFHFCKLNIASNNCNVTFRANAESFSTTGFQVLVVVLYVKS